MPVFGAFYLMVDIIGLRSIASINFASLRALEGYRIYYLLSILLYNIRDLLAVNL